MLIYDALSVKHSDCLFIIFPTYWYQLDFCIPVYGGASYLPSPWSSLGVWPDLAKFRHFCKSLKVFWKFLIVYFLFRKAMSRLWQICDIIGLIFMVANGQILKINLTIWSHCSLVGGDEYSYLPNCQSNLVIPLHAVSLLFWHFIKTTAHRLGRYKTLSPVKLRSH